MQKVNFDFEILIGEDCSSDHTRQIVEKYVNLYPDMIRLITSDKNVGGRKNALRLRENSRGKYIALCEGDDFWIDPYKLQKQADYMESYPECSMCFHAAKLVHENDHPTGKQLRPYYKSGISLTSEIITGGGEFCPTASLMFPKKYMENPPDFYMNAHIGDYPMQMLLASKGVVYYIDEVMSAYRTGVEESWTSKLNSGANVIEKNIKVKENDINLLNEFNKYTNYRYSDAIEKTKTKREFEILLLQNNIKEAKNTKFKVYFDGISSMEKAKIISKIYFPKIYSKIINLKRSLEGNKKLY